MADNPKKRKHDGYFINLQQKWEKDYVVEEIKKACPSSSEEEILNALDQAADEMQPSESRTKIQNRVIEILSEA